MIVRGQSELSFRPGMTLIEVLLGLAIFLMALVAISKLVNIGSDHALEAALQTDGMRLAQSKLAEVEAGAIAVNAPGSGTFEDEPNWNWSIESTPAGPANLYLVTVTVTHDVNGRKTEVTLSQMIFDAAVMGTGAEIPKPETDTETTTP